MIYVSFSIKKHPMFTAALITESSWRVDILCKFFLRGVIYVLLTREVLEMVLLTCCKTFGAWYLFSLINQYDSGKLFFFNRVNVYNPAEVHGVMERTCLLLSEALGSAAPYAQLCWVSHLTSLSFSFHTCKYRWMPERKHPPRCWDMTAVYWSRMAGFKQDFRVGS